MSKCNMRSAAILSAAGRELRTCGRSDDPSIADRQSRFIIRGPAAYLHRAVRRPCADETVLDIAYACAEPARRETWLVTRANHARPMIQPIGPGVIGLSRHGHTRRAVERRLEDQRAPVLKVDSVAALRP